MEAVTDLSEEAFLGFVLAQLHTGQRPLMRHFTAETLEAIEDERIGEDFCCYPFLY